MTAAVAATLLAVGVNMAFAQHAPAPPPAPAEKAHAETKPAGPAASPAAAVEQILRKLSQDVAKTQGKSPRPTAAVSHSAPPPRLQLAWRISLTWPDALKPLKP